MPKPVLSVQDVSVSFGPVWALSRVSLNLNAGEVLALVGANGAGKSTLLSVMQGDRRPDQGRVTAFGGSPRANAVREKFGIVLQEIDFPEQLTPLEVLEFGAAHFPGAQSPQDMAREFDLEALADRRIYGFSLGQKRRIALALAFIGRPGIVFLDEPTAGLDAQGRSLVMRHVQKFRADGGSVVLTSHVWEDVETLADRVAVLHDGRKVFDNRAAAIQGKLALRQVSFRLPGQTQPPDLPGIDFSAQGERWQAWVADSDALVRALVQSETPFQGLRIATPDLRASVEQLSRDGELST